MKKKTPPSKKSSKPRAAAKAPGRSVTPKKRDAKTPAAQSATSFPPTLGELDLHLFGEGRHELIYAKLGAHPLTHESVKGVSFAVWAPAAESVSGVGNFNAWDGKEQPMRRAGLSGVWETFIPKLEPGELYKYEIKAPGLPKFLKADPYAFYAEVPPATSSFVYESNYRFRDSRWIKKRAGREHFRQPLSIYEVHFGSWRRHVGQAFLPVPHPTENKPEGAGQDRLESLSYKESNRPFTYREMAGALAEYVLEMGFTHVEFLPLKEHPYGPSWGYQVRNCFAPSARYGTPDDFRYLVDYLHQKDIGVIMDWVPAHFPKDAFALPRFDGTAL